jgi:hypothetical protein
MEDEMRSDFEVTFYRELVGDNGCCRDLPICRFQVDQAADRNAAVTTAIRRFERRNNVMHWRDLAHRFDVAEVPALAPARPGAAIRRMVH